MSAPVRSRSASSGPRRATNVTLPEALLDEARRFSVNISQASERGLTLEVMEAQRRKWLAENLEAMESWNEYVEKHGIPLARHRQF